jgi:diguanylate cyclase (GGDEF)-like protein
MTQTVCYFSLFGLAVLWITFIFPFLRKFPHSSCACLYCVGVTVLVMATLTGFANLCGEGVLSPLLVLTLAGVGTILVSVGGFHGARLLLRENEEYRCSAMQDPLTGILNRRGFAESVKRELNRAKRYNSTFTLAFFDIDNFKDINDTYGHPYGDRLLQIVAESFLSTCRETDYVARLGGDEFCILFVQSGRIQAERIANRCCELLKELTKQWGISLDISAGLASYPDDGTDLVTLLSKADQFMYASKRQSKSSTSEEQTPQTQTNQQQPREDKTPLT